MVGFDGKNDRQITLSQRQRVVAALESRRQVPVVHVVAARQSAKGNQVWLLDRNGGEAFQLTEVKGRLQGYEWSPDSKRLALVVGDPDPDAAIAPAARRDPADAARARRSRS